jgi:3-hydroxybutyryl-CoA dehydrogenase
LRAEDISTVAVIGAGTMGSVLAGEFARIGCRVRLTDVDRQTVKKGLERLRKAHGALVASGRLSVGDVRSAHRRIAAGTDVEKACGGADLVIEAVSEELALKKQVFASLDAATPGSAILATNTSGLSVTEIAAATSRPAQVAGMHFWNPPHIMPLVEVVKGEKTSATTARVLVDVATRLGKRPILVNRDVPGFVGNRLQFAVLREALHLVAEGVASAEDVDAAMTSGPGLRWGVLGPLRIADLGGLDVFHAISSYLFRELSGATEPPAMLTEQVREQRLGAKSGAGFYRYTKKEVDALIARRDRLLQRFLDVLREG